MSKNKNQLGLFDPDADYAKKKVLIVWAWGVGSTSAYYITQMGMSDVTVVDFDEVEIHNTSSQFYRQEDIGKMKVEALKENLMMFNGVSINAIVDKYNISQLEWVDIVICAVDDMDIRKQIVMDCEEESIEHVIETRMAGEDFMIFSFNPVFESERWLEYRYSKEEALPEVCTMKAISYNTGMIWSIVAKLMKEITRWELTPFIIRVDWILSINRDI